jgi:hypothetical protein
MLGLDSAFAWVHTCEVFVRDALKDKLIEWRREIFGVVSAAGIAGIQKNAGVLNNAGGLNSSSSKRNSIMSMTSNRSAKNEKAGRNSLLENDDLVDVTNESMNQGSMNHGIRSRTNSTDVGGNSGDCNTNATNVNNGNGNATNNGNGNDETPHPFTHPNYTAYTLLNWLLSKPVYLTAVCNFVVCCGGLIYATRNGVHLLETMDRYCPTYCLLFSAICEFIVFG